MQWQRRLGQTFLACAVVLALVLSARDILIAAPTTQLEAAYAAAAPTAPDDPAWANAAEVQLPLMAQAGIPPALTQVSITAVKVRAIQDGQSISFLLEWADDSRDALSIKPDQFRDAAALQFGVGDAIPAICMGAPTGQANLWHWKADWQEDIDKGYQEIPQAYPNFFKDYYPYVKNGTAPFDVTKDWDNPQAKAYIIGQAAGNLHSQFDRKSPVEELLAAGFGTATTKNVQNVTGKGVWANGTWKVVFTRPLAVQDSAAPTFAAGKKQSIAVAVWNGANKEVGSRKQTTTFVTLSLSDKGATLATDAAAGGAAGAPAGATPGATPATAPKAAEHEAAPLTRQLIAVPAALLLAACVIWLFVIGYILRRRQA